MEMPIDFMNKGQEELHAAQDWFVDQVRFNLDDTQWHLFSDALNSPAKLIHTIKKLLNEPSILDEPKS